MSWFYRAMVCFAHAPSISVVTSGILSSPTAIRTFLVPVLSQASDLLELCCLVMKRSTPPAKRVRLVATISQSHQGNE